MSDNNAHPPQPPAVPLTTENRTPRAKACTFCRSSKHRCDGQDGVLDCSRCVRNMRKCTWPERKQMGRKPKNLKRTASEAELAQRELPAIAVFQGEVSSPSSLNVPFLQPNLGWDFDFAPPPPIVSISESLGFNIQDLPSLTPPHPPLAEVIPPLVWDSSSPSADSLAPGSSRSGSIPFEPRFPPEMGNPEVLKKLIDIYFSIPHLFLPILPQKDEFLSDLDNQSSLLLNSLFALASTYASFPAQQDYRTIAIGKLEATALAPMLPISTESIQYMQSLLILVYLEFGRANIPFACELMSRACQFAQKQGWNMLDSMGNPGNGSPTGSTVALRNQNSTPLSAEAQMHLRIRVIWWECWACDVVMSVTCRQPRNLHGVALNVNLPAAPALYREPACPIVWYYPLRVRVMSLLVEAIGFPACRDEAQRQAQTEQFVTFDTLIDNLMMEVNLAWADCMKITTGYGKRLANTPLGVQAAIGKELFFMTILMLNAASIHLHHLYAMPEVNFDLEVCGIATGFGLVELQQRNANSDYSTNVFKPSLEKIVGSSRNLMGLMRQSHKASQETINIGQHTLPSIGLTSHMGGSSSEMDPTAGAEDQMAVTEDILRHSPFCGCSQVVAAFGSALEVATSSSKWQAMAAESNFGTSKMVLQRLKRVWPVAAVFEDELDKCHGAVQGALHLW